MALRFRNEHVINSLRSAYSLTHQDDSLLLNDDFVAGTEPSDPDALEAYIANLNLKHQKEVAAEPRIKNLGVPRSDSVNFREDLFNRDLQIDVPSFTDSKHFGLDIDEEEDDDDDEDEDDDDEDDVGDESDFEDDMLRATKEIKHNQFDGGSVNTGDTGKPRANSRFSQKSSNSMSGRSANIFDTSEAFAKRTDLMAAPSTKSQLTNQLTVTQRDPREQYLEATTGLKLGQAHGLTLTMHLKDKPPFKITVKDTCSAHLAIGFALLTAEEDAGDANAFNLRLVEDDGEVDEDFPALDRTRPIASYQVDEFALVKATEAEFRENSKRTPNKVPFKSRRPTAPTPANPTPAGPGSANTDVHRANPPPKPRQPSVTFSAMRPPQTQSQEPKGSAYDKTGSRTSVQYATSFTDTRNDFVVVKVYMHPYDPILSRPFWTDEMVLKQTKVSEVFDQMCREKMMDSDMYVLRSVAQPAKGKSDQSRDIDMKAPVLSLTVKPSPRTMPTLSVALGMSSAVTQEEENPYVTLELIPKRQLQGSENLIRRSASQSLANHAASHITHPGRQSPAKKKPNNELQNAVLAMQPLGFYKYPVVRRQQMNFLGRSERELVIDGEYIHIMPPTDWSLLDQPKTTTFHIRQVVRVKQSRKVRTNVSIVVMKPSGPKRYDLESKDAATAAEIVEQLIRLKKANAKPIL